MSQNKKPGSISSDDAASSFSFLDEDEKPTDSIMHDSVHVYRHQSEFRIPAFYLRLKTCPENKEICCSPVINVPTNPPTCWQFTFFKHPNTSNKRYFSACFRLVSAEETTTCTGKLELYNKTEKRLTFVEFNGDFKTQTYVANIYKSEDILLPSICGAMMDNDFFILRCELGVLQKGYPCFPSQETNSITKKKGVFDFDWKNLWKTIEIDDVVTLKLADCEYRAHKSILSASSPVFAAMFRKDTKENQTNEVIIEDLDEVTLKTLLIFVYSNQTPTEADLNEETAWAALITAEKYMLTGLKEKCEDFLIKKVSWETYFEYLKLSDMFYCARLKREILRFLSSKLPHEITSPELWKRLIDTNFAFWLADAVSGVTSINKDSKKTSTAAKSSISGID